MEIPGIAVAAPDSSSAAQRSPRRRLFHPAWTMVAVASLALIAAGSFTTLAGLVTEPLLDAERWSRSGIGVGVAVSMVLYGAVAPFAAALMERYGLRRVTASALAILVASSILVTQCAPTVLWFVLWWGLMVGVGTGSVTMVFGATVANRWFHEKVGFATGLLTAASVVGQFATLPLLSVVLSHTDWRGPVLACGVLAAVALAGVLLFLRDSPRAVGVRAYGRAEVAPEYGAAPRSHGRNSFLRTIEFLVLCLRDRRFWILAVMFALCGATTNGLMWSHFTPAAHDHGMAATTASSLLAVVGFANIAGTVTAGWLSDRIEPRILLAVFFVGRGLSLAALPLLFAADLEPDLVVFALVFGILDVATVPPTLALLRSFFGNDSALVFGWVNVFHQVGAGTMALVGGLVRDLNGSYTPVWLASAVVCLVAAALGATTTRIHHNTFS